MSIILLYSTDFCTSNSMLRKVLTGQNYFLSNFEDLIFEENNRVFYYNIIS